jgi:hypothetical protein
MRTTDKPGSPIAASCLQSTCLPHILAPSPEDVQAAIDHAQPALFRGVGPPTGGAGRLLTTNDLRESFGDKPVTVSVSKTGAFRYELRSMTKPKIMAFSEFAAYVENTNRRSTKRLYLSQFPIDSVPDIIRRDIAVPHMPAPTWAITKNLWFGPAGTISPFHFDRSHNLLHQHYGRKHIVIVAPIFSSLMNAGSKNSSSPHVSSLDLVTPSSTVKLSSIGVPYTELILEPGDTLFLPAFWWHNIIALDGSISVNYWWRPPLRDCFWPNFARMVSSRSVYHDPSVIARWVDITPHKADTTCCLFLADEGQTFAGAALAGALVTAFCTKVLRTFGATEAAPASERGGLPDFRQAAIVVSALISQGIANRSQGRLLLQWLELAAGAAEAPEPLVYGLQEAAAIRHFIERLHIEVGEDLLTY